MSEALKIISNPGLTYKEQVYALANATVKIDDTLDFGQAYYQALSENCINDLSEGKLPIAPRYSVPDYQQLIDKGSAFLELTPATTLLEATTHLMIMYQNFPSYYPIYLGNFGDLLEPFVADMENDYPIIRLFMLQIYRTLSDSFVHGNIGPKDTKAARMVLRAARELQAPIPNLSILYDEQLTSDEFALDCVDTMLKCAKPSFANDKMYRENYGDYAIVSCYNALKMGGGGHTLSRLMLGSIAKKASSIEDFRTNLLPYYSKIQGDYMNLKIKFLIEESGFFKGHYFVKEGFVQPENYIGIFGVVGLAECVNVLLGITDPSKGYGNNQLADELGVTILNDIEGLLRDMPALYASGNNDRFYLHAQVGTAEDAFGENSPGVRIPVGSEPEVNKQVKYSSKTHQHFVSGVGDIYQFDETWLNNEGALLDIIKGGFRQGMRYFSGYLYNNDVVRVTGYLVKRSDIIKLENGEQILNYATLLGKGQRDNGHAFDRRVANDE